jgi:hypothetical protein
MLSTKNWKHSKKDRGLFRIDAIDKLATLNTNMIQFGNSILTSIPSASC